MISPQVSNLFSGFNSANPNLTSSLHEQLMFLSTDAELEESEASVMEEFKVAGPTEIWIRRILDTHHNIDPTLAGRLGEANWQRFQTISERMDAVEDADYETIDDEWDDLGDLPVFSQKTKSTRGQSSVFSPSGIGGSGVGTTTATSISQSGFDCTSPLSLKGTVAKDTRSQATYTSVLADGRGERGWLRIPALPIKEEELGNPFKCTICGERPFEIMTRSDWKHHVFADLRPYICTFAECKDGIKSYPSRELWANHEFTVHRFSKSWACNDCSLVFHDDQSFRLHLRSDHKYSQLTEAQIDTMIKVAERLNSTSNANAPCPFCAEIPEPSNRNFITHVARHMEEIALAVLRRDDSDFEFEHGSISSSYSLPAILGKAAEQNIANPAAMKPPSSNILQAGLGLDDFNFISTIGKGNSAKVMLAESKQSKKLYAIKVLKKELLVENDETRFAKIEGRILKLATEESHPFMVHLCGTVQSETRLCFVMEYVPGGDLMWHIQKGPFAQERAQFYAAEICLVLKFLHASGILYRDLRLENIMLALDGHIKVIDFGVCAEDIWYGNTTHTFCGNSEFIAPEILLDKEYGHAVDWWSFGVLIYQMHFRQSPFRGEDADEVYDAILTDEPLYPINSPQITVDVCQNLLKREPKQRLGSGPTDAQEVMNHPYFNGINWDDLYHKRVPTPYKPTISSDADTSNFDTEITRVTPVLTPVKSVLSQAMQEEFSGFSSCSQEI